MPDATAANRFKADGNAAFQKAAYSDAELLYTRAISCDDTNPILYTNRALTRLRMHTYEGALHDAQTALSLKPTASGMLKAYTYVGQAHLALKQPAQALEASRKAYELAVEQRSPSTGGIAQTVLECKKAVWEQRERERVLREQDTLRNVLEIIQRDAERRMQDGEAAQVLAETERLKSEVEEVFAAADKERAKRREVPEWLVDQISFGVMIDPVMTKNGHSYDRATVLDHLKRSNTDPLTREPLYESDLRPNLNLRQASEEFLKENGWAVDW